VTPEPAPRLEFVLGQADDMRAEAYVRLVGGPADATIAGTLTGPRCRLATTLPTTTPLRTLTGAGPAAARAIITEPSFWTPELPNLYELAAEARTVASVVTATRQLVGLRRLGVRGRSIWLDGRRWVPRGRATAGESFDPVRLRTASLTAVVDDPSADQCAEADAAGVPLVVLPDPALDEPALAERVAMWSQHPAVVLVILEHGRVSALAAAGLGRGTMLVGCMADAAQPPPAELPIGSHCLVARLAPGATPAEIWRDHAPAVPIIAWREGEGHGRRACDHLQAELAAWACAEKSGPPWDWAGYLVR
jgi:hypothetical protein